MRPMYSDELWHFRTPGSKNGIRLYQYKDGSYTPLGRIHYGIGQARARREAKQQEAAEAIRSGSFTKAGKKKNAKEIAKLSSGRRPDEAVEMASKMIERSGINTQKLTSSWKEFIDAADVNEDFYHSNEAREASKRAYDRTYEDLKRLDPDYLKEIVKMNNGSKEGLDRFHDFRKMFEGNEDEEWSKAEKVYYSDPNRARAKQREDEAFKRYKIECKNLCDSLIGDYGKIKVKVDGNMVTKQHCRDVKTIVDYAISTSRFIPEREKKK